jgi:hypothetical protein
MLNPSASRLAKPSTMAMPGYSPGDRWHLELQLRRQRQPHREGATSDGLTWTYGFDQRNQLVWVEEREADETCSSGSNSAMMPSATGSRRRLTKTATRRRTRPSVMPSTAGRTSASRWWATRNGTLVRRQVCEKKELRPLVFPWRLRPRGLQLRRAQGEALGDL